MSKSTLGRIAIALALLQLASCGGDNGSPEGDGDSPDPDHLGRVIVEIEPDAIAAAWDLSGPAGYHGSGSTDSTLTDMPPGEYTVSWTEVANWIAPAAEVRTLPADGTLAFAGCYTEAGFTPSDFVLVLGGTSIMGSPLAEMGSDSDEHPQHDVHFTRAFLMQTTEVTNQQYLELAQWAVDAGLATATDTILYDATVGSEAILMWVGDGYSEIACSDGVLSLRNVGGHGVNPDHPVHHVTWYGAAAYCDWLNIKAGLYRTYDHQTWECNEHEPYSARGYRLPTEAEWEHACRARSTTAFANGPITERFCEFDPVLDEIGWYCGNSVDHWSSAVGLKIANAVGLYDLHGNVEEWCNDWYREDEYSSHGAMAVDPPGPRVGYSMRVRRGGTWRYGADLCRSASRDAAFPVTSDRHVGFRPVKSCWSFQW